MRVRARQWLLLCGLALAVVGMHQLPFMSHEAASAGIHGAVAPVQSIMDTGAHASDDNSGDGTEHDLLHPCEAVLSTTGNVLLLVWLLMVVRRRMPDPVIGLERLGRHVWRPPRAAGRSLLTFVCVART